MKCIRIKDLPGKGSPRKVGSSYVFKGHTKRHTIVSAHHVLPDAEVRNVECWVYYLENGNHFVEGVWT
jgi:hypothetical protein